MKYWLLPDGINESLPAEAESLEAMRRKLLDLYRGWGYRFVMPPLVEYVESLSIAMGSQLDLQTFKITDQSNGRMMGVRADITPQVARIDSHRMSLLPNQPNRLCYIGSVLRTHSAVAGGSRSPIQVGAELFGHAGIESDFEVISLMVETLQLAGASKVVLDLGHVGILRALMASVGLSAKQEAVYLDQLERKSLPEIERWLNESAFDQQTCELLRSVPLLHGDAGLLTGKAAKQLSAGGEPVLKALDYLDSLTRKLLQAYPALMINIDLAEMRGYAYHTGIVYAAYIAGSGSEVARGGRYDGIGENFGNARPATGFSCNLRTLLALSVDTGLSGEDSNANGILAPVSDDAELAALVARLRADGEIVIRQLVTVESVAADVQGCNRVIKQVSGKWQIVATT
ncbi:MAG: ATP phosphoribosyltransferase regulatory subunit [Leucothrix sp.]